MPQEEVYGTRDMTYSRWHRRESTARFVGIEKAQLLAMMDVDAAAWVEFDDQTKEPVALFETAKDVGQDIKPATVLRRLAKRCSPLLPAYLVLFSPTETGDISSFRIKRLWPDPESHWTIKTPGEYANFLLRVRERSASHIDSAMTETGF